MRILVTGSRDWPDYPAVGAALVRAVEAWADLHPEVGCGVTNWVTVVHGACPTGADMFADDFCKHVTGWAVESHPADWNAHGRAAGFLRNAEMVDRGADVCLAFIGSCTSPRCSKREPHPSHGATHTADLAERRGIPTVRFHPTDSRPIQDGPLPPLTPSDDSPLPTTPETRASAMTQQPYGQPAYPPAPPYQQPPAPQQYAPQYPQAPQQPYPAAPPQQYAPPAYGPPQPPAQPLATGNLEDFYNQPSSASGPSISWTDKQGSPKPIGTTYVGVVARDVTNADVQQQTDFRTQAPLFYRDGRPKFAMKVPLKGVTVYDPAGNVLPNTDFPEGEGTWFVKGQARDELVRAMAEAGREGSPTSGATLVIRLVQRRPSGPGMNPANIVQVQYHPGAAGTGAPSPAPVPAEVPQAPQVAYQQPAPQQQYAPPQVPAQPAYQPPVQQVPVQQPAPQGAPQPPQGLSAEQLDLLARLTAQQQQAGTPAA